jgi:hypothetical protein
MTHHEALDFGMFWTGAMFAFTPIIIATIVFTVWWVNRKRRQRPTDTDAGGDAHQSPTA